MIDDENDPLSPDERANLEAMARLVQELTGKEMTKLTAEGLASLLRGNQS